MAATGDGLALAPGLTLLRPQGVFQVRSTTLLAPGLQELFLPTEAGDVASTPLPPWCGFCW